MRLSLLGPVVLSGPTGTLARRASQHRRVALLALLASSPEGTISRDRALGLLWPDSDEHTARHRLADSAYVLRRAFGAAAITGGAEELHLSTEVLSVDLVEFRHAVAAERWADAVRLYTGDFLDGFYVRDVREFEHWATVERTRLRREATRAALRLARQLEQAARVDEAAAAAERALELAPLDEATFREVVRLLVLAGNRARARTVAGEFVERLRDELGTTPSAETMRAVRELGAKSPDEPIVVAAPREPRGQRSARTREVDAVTRALILQGRYQWQQRTRPAVERAIAYFTRATERDPRAADAWCGLADAWTVMGGRAYLPADLAVARALAAAERALRIDETLPAAHTSIGGLNTVRHRWTEAEQALRRAIALDPRNAAAHHWLSLTMLTGFGAAEEALREQVIAVQLDPVAPMQVGSLGWQRYLRGEYAASRTYAEPAADLNAELEEGPAGLARVAARLGDERAALAAIASGMARRTDLHGDLLAEEASALAVLGDLREARRLTHEAAAYPVMPLNLAMAWASVGDASRAFEWLACESFLVYWAPHAVWWDPRFAELRDDPRFTRVRDRVSRLWRPEWQ